MTIREVLDQAMREMGQTEEDIWDCARYADALTPNGGAQGCCQVPPDLERRLMDEWQKLLRAGMSRGRIPPAPDFKPLFALAAEITRRGPMNQ